MDSREKATRILGGVLGGFLLTLGFAGVGLVLGWFETGDRLVHRIHDLAWGGLGGLIIALGLVAQIPRPHPAGVQQAALGVVAMAAGWALAGDLGPAILIPVVAVGLVVAIYPDRRRLGALGRPSTALMALAVLGAVPLVRYALDEAAIGRADQVSQHAREMHWAGMAALALGIVLVALLAAMRPQGWRLPAWSATLAAAVLGLGSILNPGAPSSIGTTWGAVALGGAAAFIVVAEVVRRQGAARDRAN